MEMWRLDTFRSLLGQTLVAVELNNNSRRSVKVSEVNESKSLGEGWEAFSVIFKSDEAIAHGSLELSHESHGATAVFLTPISENEFEAIFNHEL